MKKVVFLLFIVYGIFIASCSTSSDNKKVNNKEEEMTKAYKTGAVCPVLLKELESMIAYNDSIDIGSTITGNVYLVYFSQNEINCNITIYQSLCYYQTFYPQTLSSPSYNIEGFTLLKNKMIAFYNLKNECNKGLVDITKLEKGKPKDFPDENSNVAIHTTYESSGNKYKIHNKDSLELIYSGYL